MNPSTISILSFTRPYHDPRVSRQIHYLSQAGHTLTVFGIGDSLKEETPAPNVRLFSFPLQKTLALRIQKGILLPLRQFETFFWKQPWVQQMWAKREALQGTQVLITNDIETLPLAFALAQYTHAKLFLDAHEYAPRQFEDRWLWRVTILPFTKAICHRYLSSVDVMFTVAPGIAQEYQRQFGVKPILLYNTPPYYDLTPQPRPPHAPIRLVHHGGAIPSRRLELMIEAMQWLDEHFTLDFYLVPSNRRYLQKLQHLAKQDQRIRFHKPVPLKKIVPTLHQYDVGVFLLPPTNFNYAHALPNKFFEFIQARLAVAIGPSPDMQTILQQGSIGVVSSDFTPQSFAKVLSSLNHASINQMKLHSHQLAATYAAEKQYQKLLDLIAQYTG